VIKKGRYRHFKGNEYRVIGVATHTESEEELVGYQALDANGCLWARPLSMFQETVEVAGKLVPRFMIVEPEEQEYEHKKV